MGDVDFSFRSGRELVKVASVHGISGECVIVHHV